MNKLTTLRRYPGTTAFCRFVRSGFIALIALLLIGSREAAGATIYWDGTGTDWGQVTSWSTDANAIAPDPSAVPGAADLAVFSISSILSAPQTVNLNANRSALGLSFLGINISPTTLLGGGTNRVLTLGPSGITVAAGSGPVSIGSATAGQNVALSLSAAQSFQNDSLSALTIANGVSLVSGVNALTLTGASNAANTIAGVISNGGGTLSLVKSGTGTWTLSGLNTFTGGVTLNSGRLNINNAAALGASTGAFVINGGSIDNTTNLAITTGSNPLTINGDFTFLGGRGTTHDLNLGAGAATLGTAAGTSRTITSNEGTLTLSGIIANGTTANSIIKAGAGALSLSAANTFTGGVTLNAGTLNINNAKALGTGAFAINGGSIDNTTGAAVTLSPSIPITIGGNFSFNGGSGTTHDLNLGTGNTDLGTAVRTINTDGGILTLGGSISGAGGGITKTGPGMLTLSGVTNTFTGATTVNAGTLRLDYTSSTTKLADGASLTLGGGTLDLSGGNHTELVLSTTLAAGTTSTVSRSTGTSVLQMNAITPGAGAFLKFTASGAATTDNLNNAGGILGGWATITVGGVTSWAVNSTNGADGSITALALGAPSTTDVNRLGGTIANTATNNVRIIEAGAPGNITLAASPLTQINSLNMIATGGLATIDPTSNTDVFSIGDNTGGGILHPSTAGGLTIGTVSGDGILTTGGTADAVPATLYITNEHATNLVTINSNIQNNGTDVVGISKSGVGTLLVAGTNTYSGPTIVSQGTLRAGSTTAFGNLSAVTLASTPSTALDLNSFSLAIGSLAGGGGTGGNVSLGTGLLTTGGDNTSTAFAGVITGTGGVTKLGTGTWTLSGGNSYTGTTTITKGNVVLSPSANVQVLSDRTAVVMTNATATSLNLSGRSETIGSLAGATSTTFTGTNGTVILGTNGALTTGGNNTSTTYPGVISGTGSSVTKVGTGTMTLNGVNTFATLNIDAGGVTMANATNTIANTASVRLRGPTAVLTANVNETIGGISSVAGSNIALTGTLTVTNTVAAGTSLNTSTQASNRLVTVESTEALSEGMLVSGTGINAGSRVAQILSRTTFLLDQNASSTGTNLINYLGSDIIAGNTSGNGGLTKTGTGELRVTGSFGNAGAITVNNGPDATVLTSPESMLLIGSTLKPGNVLSDTATLVVGTGSLTPLSIDFVQNDTNLAGFERVGGLSGGSSLTTINLLNRASATIMAIGNNNASTTWSGIIAGDNAGTWVLKEGTGRLTLNNLNTNDGVWHVDNGTLVTGSTVGDAIDDASLIWVNNRTGAGFEVGLADTVSGLGGGGKGASRTFSLNGAPVGFLSGNYITGTGGDTLLNDTLTMSNDTAANTYVYGGVISGTLVGIEKSNRSTLELRGANTYTGSTVIRSSGTDNTLGVLRLGVYGGASGLGPVGTGGQGSLSPLTDVTMISGATNRNTQFDLNGASQTVNSLTSVGGATSTVSLRNGSLTVNTLTGSSGSFNGVISGTGDVNVTKTGGTRWDLTGNNTFTGTLNVTGSSNVRLNAVVGGTIADAASINVGTGAIVVVNKAEVVASISGGGTFDIDPGASGELFRVANGASGSISATGFSGSLTSSASLANFQLSGGGLRMSGNNTSFLGSFTIGSDASGNVRSPASLILDYSGGATDIVPAGPSGTGGVVFGGASVFLKGTAADATPKVTLTPGASQITDHPASTARLDMGTLVHATGGTIHIGAGAASTTNVNGSGGIIGGYATFGAAGNTLYQGTTWAVSQGAGVPITGLATYTASTGAANFGAAVNYDATINDTETGAVNTLRYNTFASVNLALTGASTITSGGILVTAAVGPGTSQISGAGSLGTAAGDIIVHQYNTLGSLVIGVPITDTPSAAGLTKAGPGTLVLTATNSFTGLVTVGAGRLQIGNGGTTGNLGTGALTVVNNGVLAVNRSNAFSISNPIDGTGWLRQEGSGTLRLAASTSNYSGRTSVGAGLTLEVSSSAITTVGLLSGLGSAAGFTSVEQGGTLTIGDGSNASVDLAETIILKGATLKDNTIAGVNSILTGAIGLQGLTNTLQTNTLNDFMRLQGLILGSPDTSSSAGKQPSNVVIGGSGTTTFENGQNTYFGTTTINSGAGLQLGTNSAGALGRGDIIDNGTLITNVNDGHYVLTNTITGTGSFVQNRNTVYLTGDNTYSGTTTVTPRAGENIGVELRVGMDTYTGSLGTGAINLNGGTFLGTSGAANLRYHLNQDYTLNNVINLNPNTDGTNGKNVTFLRQGLGSMTLTGTVNVGSTTAAPGTQRAILQTESGAKLNFNATLSNNGGGGTNIMNIVNNGIVVFGGTASNTYDGILSGTNTVWVFDNSGTTTLRGINTTTHNTGIASANNYIRKGTVVIGTGGVNTIENDNDLHVLKGGTLSVAGNETIGQLFAQRGALVTIAAGQTLTVDDNGAALMAGVISGAGGNLTIGATADNQTAYVAMYGTNTATGNLVIGGSGGTTGRFGGIQTPNLTNAIGSFSSITLGVAGGSGGFIDYVGGGETFSGGITLAGAGTSNRITGNGAGALVLSGNLTANATSTLQLTGQTGGYYNPITNKVTGAITEGVNVLSLAMPAVINDDRFGVTGRWALTNKTNDFSGGISVNVGILEIGGILNDGGAGLGGLGTGAGATSSMGDLTATRTIDLGTANFDGRRYDGGGGGDQIGAAGAGTITNTLTPNSGSTGTILFNDPNTGTATLGSNITFTQSFSNTTNPGAGQIINDGAKTIVINGNLTSGAEGARSWILDGSNNGANAINGVISNGSGTAVVSILKEGAGSWTLNNVANTFTGNVTVNRGTLKVNGGGAIGNAATVAVSDAGGDGLATINHATFQVAGSETIGLLTGNIGSSVIIDASQLLTLAGGDSTFNGVISGAGGLVKTVTTTTAGTITVPNKNTYTGVTTIGTAGSAAAGITVYQLADGGFASGLGQSSNSAANLLFSNAANTGRGLTWQGFTNQTTDRLFTMGAGAGAATINASGTVIGTTAPTLKFTNSGAIAFNGAAPATFTLGGTTISENEFAPQITNNGANATSLVKTGAGMWVLKNTAANSFTGGTSITGGTLVVEAANSLGSGTVAINSAGGTGVGLLLRNSVTITNAITNAADLGSIGTQTGGNVISGTVNLNTGTGAVGARISTLSGSSLTLTNVVSGGTPVANTALAKYGAGDLILTNTNTFTGRTLVAGGRLVLDYTGGTGSKLADAAVLTLGASGQTTILGVDDNVGGQTYVLGNTGGTIDLAGNATGIHTELVLSTTLNPGANAITRTGANTATINLGVITRNAGATIDFGTAAIAGTSSPNVNSILGGYATVGKSTWAVAATLPTGITGLGSYTASSPVGNWVAASNIDVTAGATPGTLANSLRFNTAAPVTLTLGGTLSMGSAGLLVTPTVGTNNTVITGGAIQNAATTAGLDALIIHQHSTGILEIASAIQNNTNAQGLTKSGAGLAILSGANTFTGAININEGTLQIGGTAAAPTTANAGTLGANPAINLSEGATLTFLSNNAGVQDLGLITGGGTINIGHSGTMVGNNTQTILMNDASTGVYNINVNSGTLRIGLNNAALGDIRGITTLRGGTTLEIADSTARNFAELITYNQGNPDNATAPVTISNLGSEAVTMTLSGKQTLVNSTAAGVSFNVGAPTTAGTVGLNITGIIYGSNGFTKTGAGILQISANNFTDVIDGFTGANRTPSLLGQIKVDQGILYAGNARALGATGAGNETVVASGATVDLRGLALNYGDDSDPSREILKISGTGVNGTGALRNTTGTGQLAGLVLDNNATISGGGFVNGSRLDLATFDTNINNGSTLDGNFTRNQPTLAGNGKDLVVLGSTTNANFVMHETNITSALNSITVKEGVMRIEQDVGPNTAWNGVTSANVTNGITIAYGGQTLADQTNATLGNGPNVGARLNFFRNSDIHHTVNIAMDGATAAANNGYNYIDIGSDTIPGVRTYLDGSIALTGTSNRNIIQTEAGGNFSVVEQGNLTAGLRAKMIIGGQITGAGGFTKTGFSELRLTNDNTFTGDLNVLRFGTSAAPWQSNTVQINGQDYQTFGNAEGWAEWGVTLNGTGAGDTGKLSGVSNINLQRRGMITLDNTTRLDATSFVTGGNDNDRINNSASLNLNDGWLRINGGTVNNTEALATAGGAKVNVQSGTNILDLYPTDDAAKNMTLTIGEITRSAGAVLRIQDLDATSTFSTAAAGDSVRVALTSIGTLTQVGGGGAAGSTNRNLVIGVLGGTIPMGLDTDFRLLGFNNANVTDLYNQQRNLQFLAGSQFMTYDSGFLRPLDDSEYFTPSSGLITTTSGGGQNVNLNDAATIMYGDTTINSLRFGALTDSNGSGGTVQTGTNLTSLTDHHAVNLYVDGTLSISSGMISSGYFTIGNSSSLATVILGGNLDFGAREAIINNQNGMYRTTDGVIATGNLEIRSNILGSGGLLKTGLAQVVLDGQNAYSGVTTINDGTLFLRNGRTALGVGGAGNGVFISGNGSLNSGNGIQVGTAAAPENIYVGVLNGSNQIMRVDNDLTNWYSNLTIDNVDVAGQAIFTPIIRTDNAATSIINGNIYGGNTAISNDVLAIDPRRLSFNSAGNNTFIIRGQIGDKSDAFGNAIPIPDVISTLPTLATVRTNENEVLRVDLGGATLETNYIFDRQYNAVGRLTLESGNLLVNYDPAGGGLDGTGFWTTAAISKIPNADSTTTAFATNGGTVFQGFQLGTTSGTGVNNGNTGLFLTRTNQVFNMASWSTVGTGAKYVGGTNDSGTVTYGNGTGSLTITGAPVQLYAANGGTVVFNQRMSGNVGTAPANFGIIKIGRGTVELQSTTLATASDANFELAGGTLVLNHNGQNVARVGSSNSAFSGGVLQVQANTTSGSTANFSTSDAVNDLVQFRAGSNEIIAEARSGQAMTVNIGNANANNSVSNMTRAAGATANFVEWSNGSGTPQITMNYNATAAVTTPKNSLITWATVGTAPRTATDFAMVDGTASNRVKGFTRLAVEEQNDVTLWSTIAGVTGAPANVSENGSSGFRGTLITETVNSVHFDAPADSRIDISGTLTVVNGGIMVASATGYANKTISGGNISAGVGAGSELIVHQYGLGNLTIDSDISGPSSLTITGPSTTNPANFNSTGVVTLVGTNVYTGKTTINGGVLSIATESSIGAVPTTSVTDQLTLNGGTLRFTGNNESMSQNRGITIGGNGGVFEITKPDGNLFIETAIASAGAFRGDLIKTGPGTLTIEGDLANNASFQGLIDVREGTLRVAGEDSTLANATTTKTIFGSSLSAADGTILRANTNLIFQMGHGSENTNNTVEWLTDEFFTFEGNNRVTAGLVGLQYLRLTDLTLQTDNKTLNLNGPIQISNDGLGRGVTFDTLGNQILRLNNGSGYLTGSGDIIKEGTGRLEFRANIPDWKGNLTINQGDVYALNQADVLGTGYLTGKTITIGSTEEAGTARLLLQNPDTVQNWAVEINNNIIIKYNPAQTKTLGMETAGNGNKISFNGTITLNDNLQIYMNDGAENGGSQNYVNFNGAFQDGPLTSGNITFFGDDAGGANDNTSGRTVNYAVLNANNSAWTGDVHISANTTYDQDQTTVVRLGHDNALNPVNDVTMNFNSILQVGGRTAAIGGLITNGGVGPFNGQSNTMGSSVNGSTEIIENAATTPGTLTINQTTPATAEVAWDAKFRDGTLNSTFFAPGTNTTQPSAALNLVKSGNGWAVLTLDNDYTGTTTVTAGILQVGRNGVGDTGAPTAAGLTVNSGATLSGTGIVQGTAVVQSGAFLKPGDAGGDTIGTLTFAGNTTLSGGSVTTLQAARPSYNNTGYVGYTAGGSYTTWINNIPTDTYSSTLSDPVLGDQHDVVSVLGTLTWASGATKLVVTNNGYTPAAGDIFDFFDWFAVSGGINVGSTLRTGLEAGTDLDLFELGGDYRWDTSLFNSQGILVVTLPGLVPEPGRVMLLVFGLAGIMLRRRRSTDQ